MQPKQKDPQKTREIILSTALRLFAERGYFATSIHDIRRSAGLSTGSIYHHFDGKEAIARAIYDNLLARMSSIVEGAAAEHTTAREKCRAIIESLFALAETEPLLVSFVLHAKHRDFLPEALPICSTRPFVLMRELIANAIAAGEVRPLDPITASSAMFGGPIRLLHLALDGVLPRPLSSYLDEITEAGWRSITA